MTYPYQPSIFDATPYALWWSYTRSFVTDVCSMNSAAWLRQVRAALGLSSVPTWDAALSDALINLARRLRSEQPDANWSPIVDRLVFDASKNAPTEIGFKLATWNAFYRQNGLRIDAITVPSNIILGYGTVADTQGQFGGHLVCRRVDTEPLPITPEELRQAEAASSMGLRVRSGESLERTPGTIDVGQEGISLRTAAIATGLILVAGGIFWATTRMESPAVKRSNRKSATARANPSKRSKRKAWT